MEALTSFLGRGGYLPHGVCIAWSPVMLWSFVLADLLIAASYFSIPVAIGHYLRRRGPGTYSWVAWLFGAFIFACGVTHVLDVWTLWQPDYALQLATKLVAAALSVLTAVALWPLLPQALRIPSVRQLQAAVQSLEAEVGRRRSAERHVQDLEQALAVSLASAEAGFIATDREGRVTRMNAVAEAATGWTQAQACSRPLREVFSCDDPHLGDARRNPVDVLVEQGTGTADRQQQLLQSRSGALTPVTLHVALTHGDDGAVRGLAMVFRDMSRMNQADADRLRLAAVVESSSDAIITKTLDGRITSWNRAAEQLFGYAAHEALGMPVQRLIPPEREAEEMRILADLAHGRTVPAFDTVRLHRDGQPVDVSVTISPLRDASGRITGGSKIARDITPRRRMEAALREREAAQLHAQQLEAENRRIVEASRLKSRFLANMSHELRTPLNAIIGFAELMQGGTVAPGSPRQHTYLGHIASSGHHLLQLINDVLDLSKIEAGRFDFDPETVDLAAVLAEVTGVLEGSLLRKQLRLQLHVDDQLGPLQLDVARLKQLLYNYLSNAIKFTPEQGLITVRARADGPAHFRVEVEDTGIGIAAEDLPRLFVEFQQLDSGYSKRHQGTGLGLALTRRLVQAQGGQVGVRSIPGQGSVFHFVLPRQPLPAPPDLASDTPRVLVIQPDSTQQAQLMHIIASAGFGADDAATGEQAVQRARRHGYDAITLDLKLPDQHGLQALASIRSGGPSRDSPVVGVSMPADSGGAATFGVADVLFKPLRSHEVVQAMARFARQGDKVSRVLVIDDDPLALDLMRATLGGIGIECTCLLDGRLALAQLDQIRPDAIVLDLMMPGFDGFAVLDALHDMPRWRELPVYVWTSMLLTDDEYAVLAQSARAIVGKGGGAVNAVLDSLRRVRRVVT